MVRKKELLQHELAISATFSSNRFDIINKDLIPPRILHAALPLVPKSTRSIILVKLKCVAQWRLARSNVFAISRTKAAAPSVFVSCSVIELFDLHQNFTHCSLSSSISHLLRHTIHTLPLFATSTPLMPSVSPPTSQRPLTWYREEHRCTSLLWPFSTFLHLCQEFHDFSSRFFCQVRVDFSGSGRNTLLSLPCTISTLLPNHTFLLPWQCFLHFFNSHFPKLVSHMLHAYVTLPMLCPFFPHCFTTVQQPGILVFFLQNPRSSSPCCRVRDLL